MVKRYPVYAGMTRKPAVGRVSMQSFFLILLATYWAMVLVYVAGGGFYGLGVTAPLYYGIWMAERKDPVIVRVVLIWLRTVGSVRNRRFWRAASWSPVPVLRAH